MYRDGTVEGNKEIDQLCSVKSKHQTRIAFNPSYGAISVHNNEMVRWPVTWPMTRSGASSQIPQDWEILTPFLINNNIEPVWVEVYDHNILDQETGEWGGELGKVIMFYVLLKKGPYSAKFHKKKIKFQLKKKFLKCKTLISRGTKRAIPHPFFLNEGFP